MLTFFAGFVIAVIISATPATTPAPTITIRNLNVQVIRTA